MQSHISSDFPILVEKKYLPKKTEIEKFTWKLTSILWKLLPKCETTRAGGRRLIPKFFPENNI